MKFRSLMTAICVLATANIVSAAPFAYVANSGTKNVSVIDTATNTITATVALPDTQSTIHPYAYGVAVGASGQYVYVGLQDTNEVAVIDAARVSEASPLPIVKRIGLGADSPGGLAVNAAETRLYVASNKSNTLIVIDITGTSASEVGRVAVEDVTVSNPEGVVLSTDGTKAYVANRATGKVAEIALDETNNTYTRTTLIPLVNNSQPMGLTINSTGTKLYAAGLGGTASVINTSTRGVTDLPVATGNISVAISPDDTKIYAPSNSLDKFYVIDGAADTVSATTYAATPGPYGSAVTPAGINKLFLTMNTVSAGNTVQVFDTTNLNAAPAVIDLTATAGAGAKPTSMGDFIGPVFTYTINATNGANCNILPLGAAIPANKYGRTFSITPTTGTCEVKVDGVSVGQPSIYKLADASVTPVNHTIDASQIAGTFYPLTGGWISSVGGYLVSTPAGISQLSKNAQFLANSTVTLTVGDTANTQVQSGSWTGDCAGTVGNTCTLTMSAAKTFGATIITKIPTLGGPVYNVTQNAYYTTIAAATAAAAANDVIKVSTDIASGSTDGTLGVLVKMSGQWKSADYTTPDTYKSLALTITNVGVIADGLTL